MDRALFEAFTAYTEAHFDEITKKIAEFVRIPSVARYDDKQTPYGPDCLRALEYLRALGEEFGLQTRMISDRCVELSADLSRSGIALWNHADVVGAGENWLYTKPFEPRLYGDYLIGRGADDNKGPAIASLYLLRMFKELGVKMRHGLKLCVGADEENGMSDAQFYAASQPAARLNIIADCGFPVCYGEKGILDAELQSIHAVDGISSLSGGIAANIVPDRAGLTLASKAHFTAEGKSAHSANPAGGENAIALLCQKALESGLMEERDARLLSFLGEVCSDPSGRTLGADGSDALSGSTTCAGTMIALDEHHRIHLHLNIRYAVSTDTDKLIQNIRAAAMAQGFTLENVKNSKPNLYPPDAPVVQAMTAVYNSLTGSNAKPYVMAGGTYARCLPNAIGFGLGGLPKPASPFPAGHGLYPHPDEALYLPNLKLALPILAAGVLAADEALEG